MPDRGMVYVFTGDGKGKTSAALGVVVRALAHGWTVGWVSWYKEARWGIGEHRFHTLLTGAAQKRLLFFPMGKGFYLQSRVVIDKKIGKKIVRAKSAVIVDDASFDDHRVAANQALAKAAELISQVDLLVLDEACNAIYDGLISEKNVLALVRGRGKTHVILTGRNASSRLTTTADLVSEIKKIKHPFDSGKLAVQGLDF